MKTGGGGGSFAYNVFFYLMFVFAVLIKQSFGSGKARPYLEIKIPPSHPHPVGSNKNL